MPTLRLATRLDEYALFDLIDRAAADMGLAVRDLERQTLAVGGWLGRLTAAVAGGDVAVSWARWRPWTRLRGAELVRRIAAGAAQDLGERPASAG